MKKRTFLICPILLIGFFLCISSCKKEDEENNVVNNVENLEGIPVLTTLSVTDISRTSVKCGGVITSDGGIAITARGICWSTDSCLTGLSNKTLDGTGVGSFSSEIISLSAGTKYYVKAYATNSKGTGFGNIVSFITQADSINTNLTDTRDGNIYKTVAIGNQIWMAENLRYLPSVNYNTLGGTSPYYYVYDYSGTIVADAKATTNYSTYGVLYNWYAAMAISSGSMVKTNLIQGVCPTGWHLPSDTEWSQFVDYLGGDSIAGRKLKEVGTMHWNTSSLEVTNETGFTALPGGNRGPNGAFNVIGTNAFWWSSAQVVTDTAWSRFFYNNNDKLYRYNYDKEYAFSVRCIKD